MDRNRQPECEGNRNDPHLLRPLRHSSISSATCNMEETKKLRRKKSSKTKAKSPDSHRRSFEPYPKIIPSAYLTHHPPNNYQTNSAISYRPNSYYPYVVAGTRHPGNYVYTQTSLQKNKMPTCTKINRQSFGSQPDTPSETLQPVRKSSVGNSSQQTTQNIISIEPINDYFKSKLRVATSFIRETFLLNPITDTDVWKREKSMLLFLFLYCTSGEANHRLNIIPTIITYLKTEAPFNNDGTLHKNPQVTKMLEFETQYYYKPILELLKRKPLENEIHQSIEEIHNNASHFARYETAPAQFGHRFHPFLYNVVRDWSWELTTKWIKDEPMQFQIYFEQLIYHFQVYKTVFNSYNVFMNQLSTKICRPTY